MTMTNCPNCGAPITQDRCPYCGTVFMDFAALQVGSPCYVKIKVDNNYILARLVVTTLELTATTDHFTYYDGMGVPLLQREAFNGFDIILEARTVCDEKLRHLTYIQTKEE